MSPWPAPAASRLSLMSIATAARRKWGGLAGGVASLPGRGSAGDPRRGPGRPRLPPASDPGPAPGTRPFRAGQTKALSRYSVRRRAGAGTEREGGPETVGWTDRSHLFFLLGGGRVVLWFCLKRGPGRAEVVEPNRGSNSARGEHLIKVNLQDCGLGTGKRSESHVSGGGVAPGRCGVLSTHCGPFLQAALSWGGQDT